MELKLSTKKIVSVCEPQPLTVKGLLHLLEATHDLRLDSSHDSPTEWMLKPHAGCTDVLIIDKGLGVQVVLDALQHLCASSSDVKAHAVVIWGISFTEAEALRFMKAGAKGIIQKSADQQSVLACLRAVVQGRSWVEGCVFRAMVPSETQTDAALTVREQQVMELVEQGYKNREIAKELGIRPGTVKIHLRHIFEKKGVRGRHGLAVNGLLQKGLIRLAS
jgi:DNA-binding NarL/FixJ family response regulator